MIEAGVQRHGDKREQKLHGWLTSKGITVLQRQSTFHISQRQESFQIPVSVLNLLALRGNDCLFYSPLSVMSAPTV